MNHLQLGAYGEDLAIRFLQNKGFEVLDRNYRFGKGELDIICKDKEVLVIIEVKTRASNVHGEPYISVSFKKQRQIVQLANRYIREKNIDLEVRFDVLSIVSNNSQTTIDHIINAFTPTLRYI